MVYSRSVEYALRALVHLAMLPENATKMAREIAEQERLPAFFLAKTLQQLARNHLLRSAKGPSGGFALRKPARKIRLIDVVRLLDGDDNFGRPVWKSFRPLHQQILHYLTTTTIADLAAESQRKRPAANRRTARKKASGEARKTGKRTAGKAKKPPPHSA